MDNASRQGTANLNIMHALSQRPEMTGSGIYLNALVRESAAHGHSNHCVVGVPPDGSQCPPGLPETNCSRVVFETGSLDFPVPGMSDVMPYKSSLFKDLKGRNLAAYQAAFARTLQDAVARFNPDVIHTNHLFLLSALIKKLFPDVPVVATCHGTDIRQYENCRHLRCFVKYFCAKMDRVIALTDDQQRIISRMYGIPPTLILR